MSEKKRGLGRGLGALIPTAPSKDDVRPAPSPVDVLIPDRNAAERDAASRDAATRDAAGADSAPAEAEPAVGRRCQR